MCALVLLGSMAVVQASCCDDAKAKGEACSHACCKKAKKAGGKGGSDQAGMSAAERGRSELATRTTDAMGNVALIQSFWRM